VNRSVGGAALLALTLALPVAAQVPEDLARCAAMEDDEERLACFDEVVRRRAEGGPRPDVSSEAVRLAVTKVSQLSDRWELDEASRQPLFTLRPHKQNYTLFGRWSDSPNTEPYEDVPAQLESLDDIEAKFQFSLKMKVWRGLFDGNGDLWIGYTQQNQWQVYNNDISSPFRETNYQPEAMLTFHTDYEVLGLRGRFVTIAFEHQSNGRSEPLSKSWNRIYAQLGFERGSFAMTIRPWYRIPESKKNDDNPDIEDYYGHADVVMQYRHHGQVFSLMGRGNVSEGKGAAQLDWSFPLYGAMRGYVQVFSGYGESMVDYNHSQNTIGLGILLSDWY
jgi:phospholipase A1